MSDIEKTDLERVIEEAAREAPVGSQPPSRDMIGEELEAVDRTFDLEPEELLGESSTTTLYKGVARAAGLEVHYNREVPHEPRTPNESIEIGGYFGIEWAYRKKRHESAAQGKADTTFHHVRWAGLANLASLKHHLHPELLPAIATHAVAKAVAEASDEKVDLNGHSWGGPVALTTAEHDRDIVRSLQLDASAGTEEHTLLEMLARGKEFVRDELSPSFPDLRRLYGLDRRMFSQMVRYIFTNIYRTGAEGIAAGRYYMVDRIARLVMSGFPVGAEQYQEDRLFPLDKVAENAYVFKHFHIHPLEGAGHMAPQLYPAETAASAIANFERLNADQPVKVG